MGAGDRVSHFVLSSTAPGFGRGARGTQGNDADLRMTPPRGTAEAELAPERTAIKAVRFQQDDRLPLPGTIITRNYKGRQLQVQVLRDGFEFDGQVYRSLSAVAKAITGSHSNGYLFFRVGQYGGER